VFLPERFSACGQRGDDGRRAWRAIDFRARRIESSGQPSSVFIGEFVRLAATRATFARCDELHAVRAHLLCDKVCLAAGRLCLAKRGCELRDDRAR